MFGTAMFKPYSIIVDFIIAYFQQKKSNIIAYRSELKGLGPAVRIPSAEMADQIVTAG